MNRINTFFPKTISKKQASDTGMAMVLILLLVGLFSHNSFYYKIAIPVLIMNMTYPMFYYYFAVIWLGFSQLLGSIVSKVLLSIVYIVFVVPVGIVRKLLGKDSLQLLDFKKEKSSVMKSRNYNYISKDIETPY